MKRTWMVLTTVVVAAVFVIALALALARSPGRRVVDWRSAVTDYLAYKGWTRDATIKQAVKARAPYKFTEEMNLSTYGEGPHYTADTSSSFNRNVTTPYPTKENGAETANSFRIGRPIPYPPTEVWCVLLQRRTTEGDTFHFIFANLHEDMYNAEWIIHVGEQAPFSPTFLERVASLNCDLDLLNLH